MMMRIFRYDIENGALHVEREIKMSPLEKRCCPRRFSGWHFDLSPDMAGTISVLLLYDMYFLYCCYMTCIFCIVAIWHVFYSYPPPTYCHLFTTRSFTDNIISKWTTENSKEYITACYVLEKNDWLVIDTYYHRKKSLTLINVTFGLTNHIKNCHASRGRFLVFLW
jgi:hypothetical protein